MRIHGGALAPRVRFAASLQNNDCQQLTLSNRTRGASAPPSRGGTMLLEVIVSIMLISVLCGVFALIMTQTMRAQQMQAHSFDRLQQSKALADQFRLDVARAKSAPEKLGPFVAGPQQMILQMEGDEHIIYAWRENILKRAALSPGDVGARVVPVPFAMTVEFIRPADDGKLVRLRLTPVDQGKVLAGQSLEFAAGLGGDWR